MGKMILLDAAKRLHDCGYTDVQLREAIPYIKQFHGKRMVVKIGGSLLDNRGVQHRFLEDVVFLTKIGLSIVLVHGGSRDLTRAMEKQGIRVRTRRGERFTDEPTLKLAIRVFRKLNRSVVKAFLKHGGSAVGFCGSVDGPIVAARKYPNDEENYVGQVRDIDTTKLEALQPGYIPVVASLGADDNGQVYNINADVVACEIAVALGATKLILLTDVEGVLGGDRQLISTLTLKTARRLISQGVVRAGMIPKVETCTSAVGRGVGKAHIISGARQGSLLREVLTEAGVGTEVIPALRKSTARSVG